MPADWPSSGAAESQAPRWALATLSRSAADAEGVTANKIATIATLPTTNFTLSTGSIAAPVLLAKIAHFFVAESPTAASVIGVKGSLIGRSDRVMASKRYRVPGAQMRGIWTLRRPRIAPP